ncbi:MAG: hypothetical protein HXS53_08600 [Theionarchaea archaeon]|nr:hypothetical protein [Theionarchaea archaeon]
MDPSNPLAIVYYYAGVMVLMAILALRRQKMRGTLRELTVLSPLGILITGITMLLLTRMHFYLTATFLSLGMCFFIIGIIPQQKLYWKKYKETLARMKEEEER